MSDYEEDILSQIPDGYDDNEPELALEEEISLLKKECAKEDIKKQNFIELYLRRKEYIENLNMEYTIECIRKKFMDEFLQVVNENIERQTIFITKFLSLDLKDISRYRELRYKLIVQDGVDKLVGFRTNLDTLRKEINSMEIVKNFQEKHDRVIEKEKQLERAHVESRFKIGVILRSLKCSEDDFQKLIINLITGEKETRKLKQAIAEVNQKITFKENETEEKQGLIKNLEEQIRVLEKEAEERKRQKEMEKYLHPRTIEHVDIFKVPMTSLRKKQKPFLQQRQIFGKGIETLLTDIKKSVPFFDGDDRLENRDAPSIQMTLSDEFDESVSSENNFVSTNENKQEISCDEQVSNKIVIGDMPYANTPPNIDKDATAVSTENIAGKIEVLQNVLIKPPAPRRLPESSTLNASLFLERGIKVTVDFSKVAKQRAVAISSDDKEKIEKLMLPRKINPVKVVTATNDEQIGQPFPGGSDCKLKQEINSEKSCSASYDAVRDLHLVHQQSTKTQHEQKIGTSVDTEKMQDNTSLDSLQQNDPNNQKKKQRSVSQILEEVGEFLSATTPRYNKPEKRKLPDDLHQDFKSQTLKPKSSDNVQSPQTEKSEDLKGLTISKSDSDVLKTYQKVSEPKQSKEDISSNKALNNERAEPTDFQSVIFNEEELLKHVSASISGSQIKASQTKAGKANQPDDQNEKNSNNESPIGELEKGEPKKKQMKKNVSNDFGDFFANLYETNENSSGFEFDNDTDINFDGWSGMGEGGDAAPSDFSIDMEGDFDNNDKASEGDDLKF